MSEVKWTSIPQMKSRPDEVRRVLLSEHTSGVYYMSVIYLSEGEKEFQLKTFFSTNKNSVLDETNAWVKAQFGKDIVWITKEENPMPDNTEAKFNQAMWDIYHRALKEAHYPANRFLQMLEENGGLETARILINSSSVSEGYTALWERKRLDLTVEAVIFDNPTWQSLFSPKELDIITKRLIAYHYPQH
jgi:hypothetical protein